MEVLENSDFDLLSHGGLAIVKSSWNILKSKLEKD